MPHPVAVTSWSGQQIRPNGRRFADDRVSLRRSHPGRASQSSQQLTRCQTEAQGAQSTQPPAPRVLIAAGGTGGHVYPAIAIADALTRNCSDRCTPVATVAFVGTRERLEWDAVHQARYEIHPITAVGLQRPLLRWANVLLPFRLVLSLFQALLLVRRLRPQVVVGTGGYIAFPTCLAACLLRVPVVIQEQNAVPGLANRVLARLASLVCVAFSGTIGHLQSGVPCIVSGNPVRASICGVQPDDAKRALGVPPECTVLAVVGGSLGAAPLNDAMAGAATVLLQREGLFILWATGPSLYQRTVSRIAAHPRMRVLPYLDDMGAVYAGAGVVVARAGAMTCSELAATGCASILIPLPSAADDHQTANARHMADHGAAVLLPEAELTPGSLTAAIRGLLDSPDTMAEMGRRAAALAPETPPAEMIAEAALRIAVSGTYQSTAPSSTHSTSNE